MDVSFILFAVVCVGSVLIIGDFARELGRRPRRWMEIAAVIGPFAIPLLYLVAAISAVRKMIVAPKPST